MTISYARRMSTVKRSFIREILKVTGDPSIISFAGGLPNPGLFPVEAVDRATQHVLATSGPQALQYSTTEGYAPLRELIAERYRTRKDIQVAPEEILITSGSQQALDLIAKVFLDPGDTVCLERPGYLGAIQAFSLLEARFADVPLDSEGPDPLILSRILDDCQPRFFYGVTNFQNPSGLTYSHQRRTEITTVLSRTETVVVEDDPYGELRFRGEDIKPLVRGYYPGPGLLMGSFSKVVAPGFRLGWIVAPQEIMNRLTVAKQAADLHTSTFSQRVIHQYLLDNEVDEHLESLRKRYSMQCQSMVRAIREHFPEEVATTDPDGGMFLWSTLPLHCSSLELFDLAIRDKVAFVPGTPFYVDGTGQNTLRLNYSNADEERIEEGIARLGQCMKKYLAGKV